MYYYTCQQPGDKNQMFIATTRANHHNIIINARVPMSEYSNLEIDYWKVILVIYVIQERNNNTFILNDQKQRTLLIL